MRCVVIVNAFPRPGETFIRHHIDALEADLVALYASPNCLVDWGGKSVPRIYALRSREPSEAGLINRVKGRALEALFGLPLPTWPSAMAELWDRYVSERRPSVALAEFGPNGICALESCARHQIPLVVHFHGYDASAILRSARYRRAFRAMFERVAGVVVVSSKMSEVLQSLGCPEHKVALIRCGASPREFPFVSRESNGGCRFVAVSSLMPVKGPLDTLRAFEQCADEIRDCSLVMCGGGKLLRKCREWARGSRHSSKIEILGAVQHEDVRAHLAKGNVFVQHSRTAPRTGAVEGSPVAIVEAALTGLPVVATNHGGIPDLVLDGVTGYLIEEGDWHGMATRMERLARDPDLRCQMGVAGRERMLRIANQDVQMDMLKRLLQRLCSEDSA